MSWKIVLLGLFFKNLEKFPLLKNQKNNLALKLFFFKKFPIKKNLQKISRKKNQKKILALKLFFFKKFPIKKSLQKIPMEKNHFFFQS